MTQYVLDYTELATLPTPGPSTDLEGSLQVACNPSAIEITLLRNYDLLIDFTFLEMLGVEAHVILNGSKSWGRITVAPRNIARNHLTAAID